MQDHYIIFDGPPGAESGRFVEVEDAFGRSINSDPAAWKDRGDGTWSLGPFRPTVAVDGVTRSKDGVIWIEGDITRLNKEMIDAAIADIVRGAPKLRKGYIGAKDYDRSNGQRSDHPYFTGPSHGTIVVRICLGPEFRPAERKLTFGEQRQALDFLAALP